VGKYGVCMFFFSYALRPARCSFEGCIVRTSIALPFIARVRSSFQRFSEGIALSDALYNPSLGGATIFAKLRSKIAKSPKIVEVCAHHFV